MIRAKETFTSLARGFQNRGANIGFFLNKKTGIYSR